MKKKGGRRKTEAPRDVGAAKKTEYTPGKRHPLGARKKKHEGYG